MSLEWQEWLAQGFGLSRQEFRELFEKPEAIPQKTERRPASHSQLAKPDAWSADLLATELMFPKHGNHPPNSKAFYEGWPITASELDADCDVRRVFSHQGSIIGYDDLLTKQILPQLKEATAGRKVPVFLFTGVGGSGKSVVM